MDQKFSDNISDLNRRDFLRGGSLATIMTMLGAVELRAEDKPKEEGGTHYNTAGAPVRCGVIGCGVQGREILNTLVRLPNAPVVAICDTYEPFLKRAKDIAPNAATTTDYRELLANKEVQAVLVATPSHQHRDVALASLKAGKHTYCEAPLANSIEEARIIAQAAKAAYKVNFQAGLQMRSDPQRRFLLEFVRTGALGTTIKARAQWQKKQSWRRTSPNPEREKEINWRLKSSSSLGLMGEIGLHQMDVMNWFINARPVSVSGFGGIVHWKDGRDVPDSIQTVFEYPGDIRLSYEATLDNSFDADYEMIFGTDAAVMIRSNKAWMFKEFDSPLLGWEVYARKDEFYKESGIALAANATKQTTASGEGSAEETPYTDTPLSHAMESFIANSRNHGAGVEDFIANFGDDEKAVKEYLTGLAKNRQPAAGWLEGFEATVMAVKANEAIIKGQKIVFQNDWFEV